MINRNIAAFCAAFESELNEFGTQKAIEIMCGKDTLNLNDYED